MSAGIENCLFITLSSIWNFFPHQLLIEKILSTKIKTSLIGQGYENKKLYDSLPVHRLADVFAT